MSGQPPAHTFFFADLAGYTALTEAMGDSEAADLAHDFYAATGGLVVEYGAERVKMIGDAVLMRPGAGLVRLDGEPRRARLGVAKSC